MTPRPESSGCSECRPAPPLSAKVGYALGQLIAVATIITVCIFVICCLLVISAAMICLAVPQ